MHEIGKTKSKFHRRHPDVVSARNVEYFPRKLSGNEWSQPGKGQMFYKLWGYRDGAIQKLL